MPRILSMHSKLTQTDDQAAHDYRFAYWLSLIALLAGIGLRCWQYWADPSLFIDEIALARNIKDLSWHHLLFTPLDYDQYCPPGFLALVKLFITVLGPSDMAFRLIPFLFSLAGMLVFFMIAKRLPGLSGPAALTLFALSPGLIRISLMMKPYGGDILLALLLLWLALKLLDGTATKKTWPLLALLGLVSVWFSYPAAFTLGAVSLALLICYFLGWRDQIKLVSLLAASSLWLLSALAAIAHARSLTDPQAFISLNHFWAAGFAPLGDGLWPSLLWFAKHVYGLFSVLTSSAPDRLIPAFYSLAGAVGALVIWPRMPRLAVLLYMQIILALIAAVSGLYPLLERLATYLLPSLIILAAFSLAAFTRLSIQKLAWLHVFLMIALVIPSIYSYAKNPVVYKTEEIKPLLAYVHKRLEPGDKIYVYYGAAQAMMFYGQRSGFAPESYEIGGCHRGNTRSYLKELDRYRGSARVWIIISHAIDRFKEKPVILSYLSSIGQLMEAKSFSGCSAFLFDLSDESKLNSANSATHPISPGGKNSLAWGCRNGPHAKYLPRPRLKN